MTTLQATVEERCWLEGRFLLRSGQTSSRYFDKFLFESDPVLLRAIAVELEKLIPKNTDAIAGLELDGVPLATALSLQANLPLVIVRKTRKDYGAQKQVEGLNVSEKRVAVIEDVVSSGRSVEAALTILEEQGAIPNSVLAVMKRGRGRSTVIGRNSIPLCCLWQMAEN